MSDVHSGSTASSPGSDSKSIAGFSKSEFMLLLTVAGVQFTHIVDFMILMPLGPQLMRLFRISPQEFGFIVSAYTVSAGIFGFIGAFFVDRFDRKTAFLASYIGFTFGTLACGIAPTYLFLLAARSLAGAFGGVLGALILSIIGDTIPQAKRGRAMGITMASFSMASVFGVPFGLFLANHLSWHAPFFFVGAIAMALSVLIAISLPSMRGHLHPDRPAPAPLKLLTNVMKDSNQVNALFFMVLLMLSQFLLVPFISPSMVANVGLQESQLPYIYLVGGGLTIFTSPLVGRFTDRFGKLHVFTIAGFLMILPYWVISHLGPTPLPIALTVTTLFFVMGNGRFIPAMAMITSTVRSETRGSFMSLNSCVQMLASGAASFIAGLIVQKSADGRLLHYNYVGYLAIAMTLIALWVGRKLKTVDA